MAFTSGTEVLVQDNEVIGWNGTKFGNFFANISTFNTDALKKDYKDLIVNWNAQKLWVSFLRPENSQEKAKRLKNNYNPR